MAHRILGIDLGSYSVKVAVASAGFRSAAIVTAYERRVPPGDGPVEERAAQTLADLIREHGLEHDLPYVGFPGDGVSLRVLDFGFSGLKRTDLEKAIGTELEGQLPHDLDELVYDFEPLPFGLTPVADADPAFVAAAASGAAPVVPPAAASPGAPPKPVAPAPPPTPRGTRVLTAATTKERVQSYLNILSARGVDPRGLITAPTAYARVADKLAALGAAPGRDEAVMVLDLGHGRTNVAVIARGRTVYARSLSRGGRHITNAISRSWGLPFDQAEGAKHTDGFIASQREPAPSEAWQRISTVIRGELTPLVRDLRQTIAACRAQTGAHVARGVVCGGGSRLRGVVSYLSEELDLPIGTVTADDLPRLIQPGGAHGAEVEPDLMLLAAGVALEGGSGRPAFDLRRGPLARKADYSFLRAKAGYLAACALVIIAFAAVNAYASLYRLRKEEDVLNERLRAATTEVLGQPATVEELEAKLQPTKESSPLPKRTAYDQLVEISNRLPPRGELKVDVLELEIEPKKITMKTVAESSAAIDTIEKKLKEVDCFTDVTRGNQSTVPEGKQVTLTIPTKCM